MKEAGNPVTSTSEPPAIRCANVAKVWGAGTDRAVEALKDFSLDVGRNEFVVLLGPSGCGKSTLLYLIAGLEDLTAGTIEGHGVPVSEPDSDRSLIFQESSLYPWLSVVGNVTFGLKLRGVSKAAAARDREGATERGRPRRLRGQAARRAVGRDAPARRGGPGARHEAERAADGRALRSSRRADAIEAAGLPDQDLARQRRFGAVRHPPYRRGDGAGRPGGGVHGATLAPSRASCLSTCPGPATRATRSFTSSATISSISWPTRSIVHSPSRSRSRTRTGSGRSAGPGCRASPRCRSRSIGAPSGHRHRMSP